MWVTSVTALLTCPGNEAGGRLSAVFREGAQSHRPTSSFSWVQLHLHHTQRCNRFCSKYHTFGCFRSNRGKQTWPLSRSLLLHFAWALFTACPRSAVESCPSAPSSSASLTASQGTPPSCAALKLPLQDIQNRNQTCERLYCKYWKKYQVQV